MRVTVSSIRYDEELFKGRDILVGLDLAETL